MNVKCPYCDCSYEISREMLGTPIGNEKLGYGWWLRCYRCRKKWWLENSFVEGVVNAPLRADRQAKIDKLSSLTGRRKAASQKKNRKRIWKILSGFWLLCGIALCYQYRTAFRDYIFNKARVLSENASNKLVMSDVQYVLNGNEMTVSGRVINTDERSIAKVAGIKVDVFDGETLVSSWKDGLDSGRLLPQQNLPFSLVKKIPVGIKNIRVEVSIF